MRLLAAWLINAVALLALPWLLPSIQIASFATALWVALVLGLINTLIRPVLLLLTLPVTLLTLGLPAGNQTGGLVQLRTNDGDLLTNQGWLGHIFGPVQAAATMFGKDETGLANTIDALDDFYANVLSGQSFHFHDINDSLGGWSFHYAYPPGST